MRCTRKHAVMWCLACCGLLSCSPQAPLFSQDFINYFAGNLFPLTPGPEPGYVMAMGINNTEQSVEFIVTAETEEILVDLNDGAVTNFATQLNLPRTISLFTDFNAPSLATVFDNTPVDWPPVPPGQLTFQDVQAAVDQLAANDADQVGSRSFLTMLRVTRVGLGPDLNVPAGSDNGIVVRPPGSDQTTTAGTFVPSNVNNLQSYDSPPDYIASFGNGDLILFLATTSSVAVSGIAVQAGVVVGEAGNFERNTFEILRREQGPISPAP